jgi:hypothetical protein
MTFFYDLNKKLDSIREKPETTHGQLNERANSKTVDQLDEIGDTPAGRQKLEKYMDKASAQVSQHWAAVQNKSHLPTDPKMAKRNAGSVAASNRYHGFGISPSARARAEKDVGEGAYQAGPDKSQIPAVNRPGNKMTLQDLEQERTQSPTSPEGLKRTQQRLSKQHPLGEKMSPAKAKSFAALAEPKDKITFADKIAGAKKEVDEMLGDVAANAMKQAMGGGRGRNAEVDEEVKSRKIAGSRYGGAKQVDKPEHDDTPKAKAKAGRPESDQLKPDWSAFGDTVKLGKHKGAVTKHEIGDKTPADERSQAADAAFKASEKSAKKVKEGSDYGQAQQIYDDLADVRAVAKQAQRGGEFPQGFASRLESVLYAAMTLIKNQQSNDAQVREEEIDEKAVSKKQAVAARIARGVQKGEVKAKPGSASAEMSKMKTGELKKFAKTDTKVLPDKKKSEAKTDSSSKAPKKKKEVEETTTSGSVATSSAPAKGKGGMSFGQGIYDSFNREVESMISEGMTINMSMNSEGQGGPTKSLTVTATEEDAEQLAQMLSNAGIASRQMPGHGAEEMFSAGPMDHEESCESCGMQTCGCGDIEEALDENNPDWPTEPTGQEDNINYYDTDGLNGRKKTGQSTVPVLASQNDRQESYAEAEEDSLYRMMEMAGITEAKSEKPDFLDVDKDGDKKEPFMKAVDDKDADTTNKDLEESLMRQLSNFKK